MSSLLPTSYLQCTQCDMKFRRKASLKWHNELRHSDTIGSRAKSTTKTAPKMEIKRKGGQKNKPAKKTKLATNLTTNPKTTFKEKGRKTKPTGLISDSTTVKFTNTPIIERKTRNILIITILSEDEEIPEKKKTPEEVKQEAQERPYPCPFCNKRFKTNRDRKRHILIHTDERPYQCDTCPKAFRQSSKLYRHRRIHTGERPYKCPDCDKTYIDSYQLTLHKRRHTGVKPFACKYCEKRYYCKASYNKHYLRIHKAVRRQKPLIFAETLSGGSKTHHVSQFGTRE